MLELKTTEGTQFDQSPILPILDFELDFTQEGQQIPTPDLWSVEPAEAEEMTRVQMVAHKHALWRSSPHCRYCGRKIAKKKKATVDHVIPRCRGGRHERSNLVLCCGPCNCAKADRTVEEWASDLAVAVTRPVEPRDVPAPSLPKSQQHQVEPAMIAAAQATESEPPCDPCPIVVERLPLIDPELLRVIPFSTGGPHIGGPMNRHHAVPTITVGQGRAMFSECPDCRLCGSAMDPEGAAAVRPVILERLDAPAILACSQCMEGDECGERKTVSPAFRCRVVSAMPTPVELAALTAVERDAWSDDELEFRGGGMVERPRSGGGRRYSRPKFETRTARCSMRLEPCGR
jgi:hypothetical protein